MIPLLLLEFALVIAAIVLALVAPRLGAGTFQYIERKFSALARRKSLAVLLVGVAGLIAGGVPRLFQGFPRPQQHDEFSYLLAADTFAHGRLTNPTHPMWQHFESFHIIHQPTYMSSYQPAQGLTLAAGKVIGGHPWFGVWFSVSLMCAAIVWTLQAWLPPGWALLGGLIAVMRIATFSYWVESYWGGSVSAIGGTLVLGALPRLIRNRRWRDSAVLGLGIAILANSRPFEGLALVLPVAGALAIWLLRGRLRIAALAPAAMLLCAAGAAMLYYNSRVALNPLRLPYAVNRSQYAVAQVFMFQEPNPIPEYRHPIMREFYVGWELKAFNLSRGWNNFESTIHEKMIYGWMFYLGPALTIALFPLWKLLRDRRIRTLVIIGAVSAVILSLSIYAAPHYWAPYIALMYTLLLQGLRHLRTWRIGGRRVGVALARSLPVICLIMIGIRAANGPVVFGIPSWCSRFAPDYHREDLITRLKNIGGRHLVIVRYAPGHVTHAEWVYNDADIDSAPVVWAREMEPARNEELIHYFGARHVWLFEPDRDLLKLRDYPQEESRQETSQ